MKSSFYLNLWSCDRLSMRTTHTPSSIFNVNDVKFFNIVTVPCKSKISILVKEMIWFHSAGTVKNTCFLGFVAKLAINRP